MKQVKKDMDELPEWQKANRGFAKPKPARRPVSAAEWQRRWKRLRRYTSNERRMFRLAAAEPNATDDSRHAWMSIELVLGYVLEEMSRLTRPTTRRPRSKP